MQATFICHRHSRVPGAEGPFTKPIHRHKVEEGSPLGQLHIDCPICGRVYVLQADAPTLSFYSDRPLEVLKIEPEAPPVAHFSPEE